MDRRAKVKVGIGTDWSARLFDGCPPSRPTVRTDRQRESIIWSGTRVQMQWAPLPPKVLPGPVARRSQAWLVQHYTEYRSTFCPGQAWVWHDESRTCPTPGARSSRCCEPGVREKANCCSHSRTGVATALARSPPARQTDRQHFSVCCILLLVSVWCMLGPRDCPPRLATQLSWDCTYTSVSCRRVKVLKVFNQWWFILSRHLKREVTEVFLIVT
jgi:hypothetical protein